jgi:hypothetical protein
MIFVMQKVSFIVLFSLLGFLEIHAQLKVGKDPKSLQTNSYFNLQSDINRHIVITKDSSKLGIGTIAPNFSLEMLGLNNNDAIAVGNSILGSSYRGKISVLGSGANDRWMKINSDWNSTTNNTRAFGFFRGSNEYLTILDNGKTGINVPSPTSQLEVNGAATNNIAFDAGSSTTIDFTKSNLAYTSASGTSFTLNGLKDGGAYTLILTSTSNTGTATFSASGFTIKNMSTSAMTSGKEHIYSFIVTGTKVYVSMNTEN